MSQYFPSYEVSKSDNIKVVLGLSVYVKKTDTYFNYSWSKSYFNNNSLAFKIKEEYFTLSNKERLRIGNQMDY